MTKRFYFANEWFLPPFSVTNYWVTDALGRDVAEAKSRELAKALAEMLNKAAEAGSK